MNTPIAEHPEAQELAELFSRPRRDPPPPAGIYQGMAMEEYLRIDAVSDSLLGQMLKSPAHAHAYIEPEGWPLSHEATLPQIVGTAAHCNLLEPATFHTRYKLGPAGKWSLKANKDAVAALRAEFPGCTVLKPYQWDAVARASAEVLDHPMAGRLIELAGGATEVTVVWQDRNTGLWCKARPDGLVAEEGVCFDLKSDMDASRRGFTRAISRWGYHRKAAFYLDGLNAAARACNPAHGITGLDYTEFVFVAFEKEPPYATAVYHLDTRSYEIGWEHYTVLLERYRQCKEAGIWPAYSPDITMIGAAEWTRYQLED